MAIVVQTAPAAEPISLLEAKAHCRVEVTDDDTLITSLIVAARQQAEVELRRYLITQTLDLYLDEFPDYDDNERAIYLPPLQSVTSISYVDTTGTTQTLAADQYIVDAMSQPARIEPAYGCYWPSIREQANAVKIRFVAGYGAAGSSVPQCIRQWMLLQVGHWYANREASGGKLDPLLFVDRLLDGERVMRIPE